MVICIVIRALAGIHRRPARIGERDPGRQGEPRAAPPTRPLSKPEQGWSLRRVQISWRAMDCRRSPDHHLQKRRLGSRAPVPGPMPPMCGVIGGAGHAKRLERTCRHAKERTMPDHEVVSREAWAVAREELL